MTHRLLYWFGTLLVGVGIILMLAAISYWLLGRDAEIARTLPTPKRPTVTRAVEKVQGAAQAVAVSLLGVKDTPVPILTYHYIRGDIDQTTDPVGYQLSVTPARFAAQLDALQTAGYTTVTPAQFLAGSIDDHSIILSFDDGYEDFYTAAFPALQKRGMNAVTFVISGFIGDQDKRYMTGDQIRELFAGGIEIGAHSVTHPNLTTLESATMQEELLQSRFTLEKLINDRVTAVAYPSGEYNDDVVSMSTFVGYRFGVTTHNGTARLSDDHLTLPRIQVHPELTPEQLVAKVRTAKQGSTTQ